MNIATTLRYVNLGDRWWAHRYYIMHDYQLMAEKLGFGMVAIMNDCDIENVCERCDGLIVPGSSTDINPKYYGGEDIPPEVDEYALDAALIKYFYEHGKPIFGICGGHQVLNIYFGGSIRRMPDPIAHQNNDVLRHEIEIKEGSFVWDVYKRDRAVVNCFHGWELDRIAPCFDVVARTNDGVAEAIEWREKHIFATQWHPERSFHDDWDDVIENKFFENFIELCRKVSENK